MGATKTVKTRDCVDTALLLRDTKAALVPFLQMLPGWSQARDDKRSP